VKKDKKIATNKRRSFIKKAGLLTLGGLTKSMQLQRVSLKLNYIMLTS